VQEVRRASDIILKLATPLLGGRHAFTRTRMQAIHLMVLAEAGRVHALINFLLFLSKENVAALQIASCS